MVGGSRFGREGSGNGPTSSGLSSAIAGVPKILDDKGLGVET
jgi:hypothetical protein